MYCLTCSPVEESSERMSSLQDTLNSLNRKLEQLKQGAQEGQTEETTVQVQPVDLARKEELIISSLPAQNTLLKEIDDLLPEPVVESDNAVDDPEPEQTTKLNIFRSSDLALTDFMLAEKETETERGGGVKANSPNMLIPTVLPAGSEAESNLKSRRRKLFKGHSKLQLSTSSPSAAREEQSEATKSKLEPSNKFKLRKLFRNSDRNEITIVEKPNPRKIIFRKGLVRGQRRKVGSGKKNDSLVKSLQKQIRTQSNRLFTKRKPFTGIAPTSTTTKTTTTNTAATTSSSSATTIAREVRNTTVMIKSTQCDFSFCRQPPRPPPL